MKMQSISYTYQARQSQQGHPGSILFPPSCLFQRDNQVVVPILAGFQQRAAAQLVLRGGGMRCMGGRAGG